MLKTSKKFNQICIYISSSFMVWGCADTTPWNQGAYWNALFRFAEAVCGKKEVQCVTYSELADFMDLQTPEQIATYQKGAFPKLDKQKVN